MEEIKRVNELKNGMLVPYLASIVVQYNSLGNVCIIWFDFDYQENHYHHINSFKAHNAHLLFNSRIFHNLESFIFLCKLKVFNF